MGSVTLVESVPERVFRLFDPGTHFYVAVKGFLSEWLICTGDELVVAKFGFAAGGPFLSSILHIPLTNIYGIYENSFAFSFAGEFCIPNGIRFESITYLGPNAARKFRMAAEIVNHRIALAMNGCREADGGRVADRAGEKP